MMRKSLVAAQVVVAMTATLFVAGCGGDSDSKPTARVSGKVTSNGAPVTGGQLLFSPMGSKDKPKPGKAGLADIKPDGTYTVSTYGNGDGAVIGQHRLQFLAPAPAPGTGAHGEPGEAKFTGLVPSKDLIEVKTGSNTLDVDLISGTPSSPQQ